MRRYIASKPLRYAERYEVYRPAQLTLAVRDRVRITVNGWDKSGKHRLKNGDLFTVQGFVGDTMAFHADIIGVPISRKEE